MARRQSVNFRGRLACTPLEMARCCGAGGCRVTGGGAWAATVPDTGFGDRGVVMLDTDPSDHVAAIAVQPDGKIIVATFAGRLVRLRPDGSVDTVFGSEGWVTVGF